MITKTTQLSDGMKVILCALAGIGPMAARNFLSRPLGALAVDGLVNVVDGTATITFRGLALVRRINQADAQSFVGEAR